MLNIKEFRSKDRALPDILNIAAIVDRINLFANGGDCAIALNKDGSLMSAFQFFGPDIDSLSYESINRISASLNQSFLRCGTGWSVHDIAIREPSEGYINEDECFFTDPVSYLVDQERRGQYALEGMHYITRYYFVISWMTPQESEVAASTLFIDSGNKNKKIVSFQSVIDSFSDNIKSMVGNLNRIMRVEALDDDSLLTLINSCISGESHKVNAPETPMYLDAIVGNHQLIGGIEPSIDGKYIRVLSAKGYPLTSKPDMIEGLHTMPFPLRVTTRFIFLDAADSKKLIDSYFEHWMGARFSARDYLGAAIDQGALPEHRANNDAVNMAADAKAATAEASQGLVRYGYFTITVILMDTDLERLDEKCSAVKLQLDSAGLISIKESVNTLEAWLGSLPGHTWENVRRPLMHSLNFADLSPKTSIWPGSEKCPNPMMKMENGMSAPVLAHAKTEGDTPYRLNLHYFDVGHTLIAGPTGSGKSTLLAFLLLQWLRYKDSRVIGFDMKHSMFTAALAAGGAYYDVGGDLSDLTFAPLSKISDSASERGFAEDWIAGACVLQGVRINPEKQQAIHDAVTALAGEKGQSLTDFRAILQDDDLKEAIGFYANVGRTGSLLDARSDTLDLTKNRITIFEMKNLFDSGKQSKKIMVPTLLYLFHRIDQMLDGRPTLIPLDESWIMLDDPMFMAVIEEWLRTLRSKNGLVVFATQSLTSLNDSPILPVIMESCPTKIYLPNIEALKDNIKPVYINFGLQDRQVELIAQSTPKENYYITSPYGQRMVNFAFGPVSLAFVGATGSRDVEKVSNLYHEYGVKWPIEWLKESLPEDIKESWVNYAESLFNPQTPGI